MHLMAITLRLKYIISSATWEAYLYVCLIRSDLSRAVDLVSST